ncbi:MAG: hypothetical protein JXK94_15560 [Deltaproteobacteria bacterium]|nr:hypothetical protein [Deltaproteobacteria bacterium]
MGKVETIIDRSKDLTLNKASGPLTIEDLVGAAKKYLSKDPTGKVLWDLKEADGSALSRGDLQEFHHHLSELPTISQKRKIAIVVSRTLGYGLSRMSEAYATSEAIPAEYYITYSIEEAMSWLEIDMTKAKNSIQNG